jgi:hypothetical protein
MQPDIADNQHFHPRSPRLWRPDPRPPRPAPSSDNARERPRVCARAPNASPAATLGEPLRFQRCTK